MEMEWTHCVSRNSKIGELKRIINCSVMSDKIRELLESIKITNEIKKLLEQYSN